MEEGVRALEAVYEEVLGQWTGSPFHPLARARGVTLVALAVARSALARNESRGAHFRTDYPERDDAHYGRSSFVSLGEGGRIVLDAAG
jgi:succinate dehydrogenase/fumarate reductase flavoprotein subunit